MNVLFTVDTELWPGSWHQLDRRLPAAFARYIQGRTASGDFGLPFKRRVLDDHGLTGVFFVEALFATRFGMEPLQDVLSMLQGGPHEVQLHLHPEWLDDMPQPPVPLCGVRRSHLSLFSQAEQRTLIATALDVLQRAGAPRPCAFRAGGFALNLDTLRALKSLGVAFDSSYNASRLGLESQLSPGGILLDAQCCEGVVEVPITVFDDGTGQLRHVQLTACSAAEIESLLWQALEAGRRHFVILSHSAELLVRDRNRPDPTMVARFARLCRFFDRHRDSFKLCGFSDLCTAPAPTVPAPAVLRSPLWRTGARVLEQAYRRSHRWPQ